MCGYPFGSGGNLVTTFPCSAFFNSGRPSLSLIFSLGAKISGNFSSISFFHNTFTKNKYFRNLNKIICMAAFESLF